MWYNARCLSAVSRCVSLSFCLSVCRSVYCTLLLLLENSNWSWSATTFIIRRLNNRTIDRALLEIAIGKSKEIAGNKYTIELWGDNALCECGVSITVSTLVSTLACLLGVRRNAVKWQRPWKKTVKDSCRNSMSRYPVIWFKQGMPRVSTA